MNSNEFKNPSISNNFSWKNLLLSVDYIKSNVSEYDEQVLNHLTKIDVLKYEDTDSYTIEFYFAENEFFENEKLTVSVVIDDKDEDN